MIPNQIRSLRKARGLTQESLAEAIGRTKSVVSRLEDGTTRLDLEIAQKVADALGVSLAEVLGIGVPAAADPSLEYANEVELIGEALPAAVNTMKPPLSTPKGARAVPGENQAFGFRRAFDRAKLATTKDVDKGSHSVWPSDYASYISWHEEPDGKTSDLKGPRATLGVEQANHAAFSPYQGLAQPVTRHLVQFRALVGSLDRAGVVPGATLTVDVSLDESRDLVQGDVVVIRIELKDIRETRLLVRQFVPPSVFVANSSVRRFPTLDRELDNVRVVGRVISATRNFDRR